MQLLSSKKTLWWHAPKEGIFLGLCLQTSSHSVKPEPGSGPFLKTALTKVTLGPCPALNSSDETTEYSILQITRKLQRKYLQKYTSSLGMEEHIVIVRFYPFPVLHFSCSSPSERVRAAGPRHKPHKAGTPSASFLPQTAALQNLGLWGPFQSSWVMAVLPEER